MSGVTFSVSGTDPVSEAYRILITYNPGLPDNWERDGLITEVVDDLGRHGYNPSVSGSRISFTIDGRPYTYELVEFTKYSELNSSDRQVVLNYYNQHKPGSYPYVVYASNKDGSVVYAGNHYGFGKFVRR